MKAEPSSQLLLMFVYLYSLKDLCQKIDQNSKSANDHQIELIIKIIAQNIKRRYK